MYFHLIWIKEKNWQKNWLDLLIQWWDEDFVRDFLANRGVVIVSISEFTEDIKSFWKIKILVSYKNTEIEIISAGDNLEEKANFIISLWLSPHFFNLIEDPVPDAVMKKMIASASQSIKQRDEQIEQQKTEEEMKEKKKYSENALADSINIVNANIERMERIIKAWEWVISWIEVKKLTDYMNEMKKIRLWTNFNKMASLVLESHELVNEAQKQILEAYDSQKVLIDKNSSVTNIDVIEDLLKINEIKEKWVFQPAELSFIESIDNMAWTNWVLFKLLKKDFSFIIGKTSLDDFFGVLMNLVEDTIDIIILVVVLTWMTTLLSWMGNFSLYLLPAMWWLGLLVYLYNNLKLKWFTSKLIWFLVLAWIYWYGLTLLINTFSL